MKPRITQKLRNIDHQLYEIWNEYTAESVFFSGRPTPDEIVEVCEKEWGGMSNFLNLGVDDYIKRWVHVERLKPVYAPRLYDDLA